MGGNWSPNYKLKVRSCVVQFKVIFYVHLRFAAIEEIELAGL